MSFGATNNPGGNFTVFTSTNGDETLYCENTGTGSGVEGVSGGTSGLTSWQGPRRDKTGWRLRYRRRDSASSYWTACRLARIGRRNSRTIRS